MLKIICAQAIYFYQKFLSPLKLPSCRFYPSCSEYAKWQFEKRTFFLAFIASFMRILKCNPYCRGGFDYPKIYKKEFNLSPYKKDMKISFFYVPYARQRFYIIKKVFKGKSGEFK